MAGIPTNIVGAASTTDIGVGDCVLERIVINRPVASATITVYDNTAASGTVVATITLPATLLEDTHVIEYNAVCNIGCTVVTTGANLDITVVTRPI